MDYHALVPEYANFVLPAAIAFAITSAVAYPLMRRYGGYTFGDMGISLFCALVIACCTAGGAGYAFSYYPNQEENIQTVKDSVAARYDASISNVKKLEADNDATKFSASLVSNRDQSAHEVMVLIAPDGTPTLINTPGFDATAIRR